MNIEQQELQFLGFFGIFRESFKIIFSWRKIFSQITLALILPLSFIFLAHFEISQLLFFKILDHELTLGDTEAGTPSYDKLSDLISSEWTSFWLFKIAYFTFFLILSLLSTAAVVYTIACIYTAKPITFKKVMSVVPKVWKRLMVTFVWSFGVVLVYNIIAGALAFMFGALLGVSSTLGIMLLVALAIVYIFGFLYISVVWHLASVVSVLEDSYGIAAMIKSKNLIKGKLGIAIAVFITMGFCFVAIQFLFEGFVVIGWPQLPLGIRIAVGILCFLLLFKVMLFGLVIQTVLYFVCKSYHHENIDKSSLSDHLEGYLGDYVRLHSKDVQMRQFEI